MGDVVVWRDKTEIESNPPEFNSGGFFRWMTAGTVWHTIETLRERWGEGPFVVYEVTDRKDEDEEFWVTTLSGLHLGGMDDGEPSFSLNTMRRDAFRTAVYRSRKAKDKMITNGNEHGEAG